MRQLGKAEIAAAGHRAALARIRQRLFLQIGDLGDALIGIGMIEMHRIDQQRAGRDDNKRFGGAALQVHRRDRAGARKRDEARGGDRKTRQDHIAELEAAIDGPAIFDGRTGIDLASRPEGGKVLRHQIAENGGKIRLAVAMKIPRHFLQRNHVGAFKTCSNAFGIETAVQTDAVLDVIAQKLHDIL